MQYQNPLPYIAMIRTTETMLKSRFFCWNKNKRYYIQVNIPNYIAHNL